MDKVNNKYAAGILSLIVYYLETNQIIISDFKFEKEIQNDILIIKYYNPTLIAQLKQE